MFACSIHLTCLWSETLNVILIKQTRKCFHHSYSKISLMQELPHLNMLYVHLISLLFLYASWPAFVCPTWVFPSTAFTFLWFFSWYFCYFLSVCFGGFFSLHIKDDLLLYPFPNLAFSYFKTTNCRWTQNHKWSKLTEVHSVNKSHLDFDWGCSHPPLWSIDFF